MRGVLFIEYVDDESEEVTKLKMMVPLPASNRPTPVVRTAAQ